MKLTEKSMEVLEMVRTNGGRMSVPSLAEALNRTERSVGANVTDLHNKELANRDYEVIPTEEGKEKKITYVVLTDAGVNFVPSED